MTKMKSALLALLGGVDLGWEALRTYIRQVVDVIVQLKRVDGSRRVVEVSFRNRSVTPTGAGRSTGSSFSGTGTTLEV